MAVSNIFYVHPDPRGNEPIWRTYFSSTGWFNHQLAMVISNNFFTINIVTPNTLSCFFPPYFSAPLFCCQRLGHRGQVGLYVDQREDVTMKPRRPYFSSADKARPGLLPVILSSFEQIYIPGIIYCIPINLWSMTNMMLNIVSEWTTLRLFWVLLMHISTFM